MARPLIVLLFFFIHVGLGCVPPENEREPDQKNPAELTDDAIAILSDTSADKEDLLSALQLVSTALDSAPEMPTALRARMSILIALGRHENARSDAIKLVEAEDSAENRLFVCLLEDFLGYPDYTDCYTNVAEYMESNEWNELIRNANYILALGLANSSKYENAKSVFFSTLDGEEKEFYEFIFNEVENSNYVKGLFQ